MSSKVSCFLWVLTYRRGEGQKDSFFSLSRLGMRDVGRAMTAACVGRGLRGGGGIVLAGTSGRLIGPFHDAWVRSDADAGFKWKEFFFFHRTRAVREGRNERGGYVGTRYFERN